MRTKKPLTGLTEGEDGGEQSHLNKGFLTEKISMTIHHQNIMTAKVFQTFAL